MTFFLIEPDLGRVSGGLRFNAELSAASGGRIEAIVAPGTWPDPSEDDVRDLRQLVAQCQATDRQKSVEPGRDADSMTELSQPVLVDGLIACNLSEPLSGPVVILQHSLAETAEGHRREARYLRAASAVLTPSAFAAAEVQQRYGITAEVARPGTGGPRVADADAMEVGVNGRGGHGPGHLICVGAMEDNKNQLFLARVLQELRRRGIADWRCTLAGPVTDPDYAQQVRTALTGLVNPQNSPGSGDPLAGQDLPVALVGELDEATVDQLYRDADLLLLPSKSETFGLVVREAAAAAVPSFVTAGTGAEEALVAGRALPLDVDTWAQALEGWLTDESARRQLAANARATRESALRGWDDTAAAVLTVLEALS